MNTNKKPDVGKKSSSINHEFSPKIRDSIKKKLIRCSTKFETPVVIENISLENYLDIFQLYCEKKEKDILCNIIFRNCRIETLDGFCKNITCRFENCHFTCTFHQNNISDAYFYNCTFFQNCNFQNSMIRHTTFEQCSFLNIGFYFSSIFSTMFQSCTMHEIFKFVECESRELTFTGSEFFSGFSIDNSTFEDCSFPSTKLSEVHCIHSNLIGTIFSSASSILNLIIEDSVDVESHVMIGPLISPDNDSFYMLLFENDVSFFHGKKYHIFELLDYVIDEDEKFPAVMDAAIAFRAFMAILSFRAEPLAKNGFFSILIARIQSTILSVEQKLMETVEKNPSLKIKNFLGEKACARSDVLNSGSTDLENFKFTFTEKSEEEEWHSFVMTPPKMKEFHELCYSTDVQKNIERILLLYKKREELKKRGLESTLRVLLYGAPGNGKTVLAGAIAKELGIPFYILDAASIRSRYTGDAGGNISKVFRGLRQQVSSCVFFLDECDSIASIRSYESGASKDDSATLNSLLTQIDELSDDYLLIAATNVSDELDPAFLRRFQQEIFIDAPNRTDIEKYLLLYEQQKKFTLSTREKKYLFNATGLSWSDIDQYIIALHQNKIIGFPNESIRLQPRKDRSHIRGFSLNA